MDSSLTSGITTGIATGFTTTRGGAPPGCLVGSVGAPFPIVSGLRLTGWVPAKAGDRVPDVDDGDPRRSKIRMLV